MDDFIRRLKLAVEEGTRNATVKTDKLLESENKKLAQKDTGRLRNSIYKKIDRRNYIADVRAKAPYANYVIRGTGIYNTQGARTTSGWYYNVSDSKSKYYGWHYTKGQMPNDFPLQAYNNNIEKIPKIFTKEIRKSLSKL